MAIKAHILCLKPFSPQLQPSKSEHLDSLKEKNSQRWVQRLTLTATLQAFFLFKKILLTPGLTGSSCRLDVLAKHPYV